MLSSRLKVRVKRAQNATVIAARALQMHAQRRQRALYLVSFHIKARGQLRHEVTKRAIKAALKGTYYANFYKM